MADMETSWEGESLPPRKRLLAGLRQNVWRASSSSSRTSTAAGELLQGIGPEQEEGEEEELAAVDGEGGGDLSVMVSSGAECSSGLKKPRMSREQAKEEYADHVDPSQSERLVLPPVSKPSQGIPVPVSSHDDAAAAAAAAAISAAAHAVKVAMAAKENAAAKASIAVKAAAAAKVALEAAAHAAREVALVQAELRRRKTVNAQPGFSESSSKLLQTFVAPESQTEERILERTEVKAERTEEGAAAVAASLDDEELAQQWHRVISSSPCISHSLGTPLQRKEAPTIPDTASSAVSMSSTDAAAWPQIIQTSPTELLLLPPPKQQQTRAQSVMHQDLKRFDDARVAVRHEVKKKITEIHQSDDAGGQQLDAFEHSSPKFSSKPSKLSVSEEISSVIKPAEATMEGVGAFSAREEDSVITAAADYPADLVEDSLTTTAAEHSAELSFDTIMAVADAGASSTHLLSDSYERRPDLLQEILEAAVLADSAMSLDEGGGADAFTPESAYRAEYYEGSVQQEGHSIFSDLLAESKEDELRMML
ncbi:unnamed protein product [Sphagnum jensenii]|uniref:Uncharacterized protein n=1 Tax=Sphagnum jensenii TaxID=128206 RepID=A0ABP1ADE7_9BRYO